MRSDFADISSNNEGIDLATYSKAGYPLIAMKLGGGIGDQWDSYPQFFQWWDEARKLGLTRWAYWYWRDIATATSGYDQAMQVMSLLKGLPRAKGDRIILDFETMMTNPVHNVDQARQFISTLLASGHSPVLYASPGFLNSYNNPKFDVDLWIADYAASLWNPGKYMIAAWQHGTVINGKGIGSPPYGAAGIGYCDMSILTAYGKRHYV